MDFNSNGVIQPGIHELSIEEVRSNFVENFTNSQSRNEIFESFLLFMGKIVAGYTPAEVWIDGSYVTNKINPNDIDILLFFSVDDYIKIYKDWDIIRIHDNIDAYCTLINSEDTKKKLNASELQDVINSRNYWRGQFGFDRNDTPKGIVKISWEVLSNYLNGGGLNCQ